MSLYDTYSHYLETYPVLTPTVFLGTVLIAALLSYAVIKLVLLRVFQRILKATKLGRDETLARHSIIPRLANIVPALVVMGGVKLVPGLPDGLIAVIHNVGIAFIILTVSLSANSLLTLGNALYERRPDARSKPIKGYIQIVKIALYAVTAILIIAALVDKSPVILLSGLGAMAAVLMLVFQDTLLSLVASIQISSSDMLRVGDWIEMPNLNADGDVIDMALHTVKVRNWDKTITTLPTRRLISDPFKNWRGMTEAGGRRIKRAIFIDQNSIRFLNAEGRERLMRFRLLKDFITGKQAEIDAWNNALGDSAADSVNLRRVTNIGMFRAYVMNYLKNHPGIHQDMTMLVRQLSPTAEGLPLEIYCFTNNTAWAVYEGIQSDIFDHLYAILPEFGLSAFQSPSGKDFAQLRQSAA